MDYAYLQKFSDEINSLIQENKALEQKNNQLQKTLDELENTRGGTDSSQLSVESMLPSPMPGREPRKITLDPHIVGTQQSWLAFLYMREKYSKFLMELPTYKGTGKVPKIFWWFWLQGEENAPLVCKAALKSLKKYYSDYQINVITLKNIDEYAKFPAHIVKKFYEQKISPTHFSDLLRSELLTNYGGIWIDSTVYCTGREKVLLNCPLFVFNSLMRGQAAHLASSYFIVSEKDSPIMNTTRQLLYKFWLDHDELGPNGFYFTFHTMFRLAVERYVNDWNKMPIMSNIPPNLLWYDMLKPFDEVRFKQLKTLSNFHKLTYKHPPELFAPENIRGTFAEHIFSILKEKK